VPAEKRSCFVTLYRSDKQGKSIADSGGGGPAGNYSAQPTALSGGGLVSTAEDYLRFAAMLANGGVLNGVRVPSPAAVHLMAWNHPAPNLLTCEFAIGLQRCGQVSDKGYDCVFNPPEADLPDGPGTFFWDGAAGT